MTGFHGQNRAMIELSKDRGFISKLDRAEQKHGFATGMRSKVDGSGLVMITVTFYPETKFFVHDVLSVTPDYEYGPHRELTQDEWNATKSFLI
jgi:hypothetical protein